MLKTKIKEKKCRSCKKSFIPFNSLQIACSPECAISIAKVKTEQKAKVENKHQREALKTHAEWLKDLQVVFNAYIRERDKGNGCISCGTKKDVQYAAGHYFSVGGFPNVRFDEDNVHLQCNKYCNEQLSGNIHNYRPALIKKIGEDRYNELEYRARNTVLKLSIPEIKAKIIQYREKIRILKKSRVN